MMPTTSDPFDDLASLFLTESETDRRLHARSTKPPFIDVILVGHLPVRAGLWIAPYADWCARSVGATALLRLDDDAPTVEFLGLPDMAESAATPHVLDAVRDFGDRVNLWVVRPRRVDDLGAVMHARPDRVTVLTGADDAAVVHAYKLIKRLVDAGGPDTDLPDLAVAVLGSDEHRAAAAVEALNDTTRRHLGLSVTMLACIPRMDADGETDGFMECLADRDTDLGEIVAAMRDADEPAPTEMPTNGQTSVTPPPPPVPSRPVELDVEPREAMDVDPPPPPIGETVRTIPFKLPPKVTHVEPKVGLRPQEPEASGAPVPLATSVAGLADLPFRCPGREHVEIAADETGRIHLLVRETGLDDVMYVTSWVRSHAEILRMAMPAGTPFDPAPCVSHLFTVEPVRVAHLHGAEVHLHVLAPVEVEGRTGWFAAPLNRVTV